jgi:hypothetical protein
MAMERAVHRVDWENLWSVEAKKKQLPSLHGQFRALLGIGVLLQPQMLMVLALLWNAACMAL